MYVKTPTIFQMESTECGAASLAMIFAYYGKYIPLEQMRIETGVSRDGCNAGNIMKAAKKYGLECHGYKKEPDSLRNIETPCIIHWNFNHFVVFEGVKGKNVYINDPAMGRRKLSWEEIDECFTGVVLTFKPTPDFVKSKKKNTTVKFISERLYGQKEVIIELLTIGILLIFPGFAIPIFSQIILDDVIIKSNANWFNGLFMLIISSVLLQVFLSLFRGFLLSKFQKKMVLLSARDFLEHLFKLPISFFEQRYVGDLSERVHNNSNISIFLSGELAETCLNIIISVFYIIVLLKYDISLTIVAMLGVIINIVIIRLTSNYLSETAIKLQQDYGKFSGAICAGISIISTLKASGTENEYTSRLLGYNARAICVEQNQSRVQSIIDSVPSTIKMLSDLLIVLIGGTKIISGEMSIGSLVAFTTLFGSFSEPIESLVGFVKNIQTTKADITRVEDILNYEIDKKYENNKKINIKTKLEGNVYLKDISFGYSILNEPIIKNFYCKIPCGTSVAFVGSSGCGKSTISKLISGLYKPWNGSILFDNIGMENIPEEVINASVATVSQNISVFSGTIKDNITMWNTNISDADIISAAKDACIHDVILQKPGAYDFLLTEGASNLSGGQKQRIEIARALVTNPTILIMDEATSALDPITEKQIIDNIKKRGCTCIIVAHRLSAIRDCDQIVLLSDGQIVQIGTHEELIKEEGLYREFTRNL